MAAAAAVGGSALAGYVVNRTVGLPQAMSDIGNWTEPLGLASLFIEGAVVVLAATVLAERGAARRALVAASKDPSSTLDVVSTWTARAWAGRSLAVRMEAPASYPTVVNLRRV